MPEVANTRKTFNFIVEVNGVNQFEIQKVDIPEVEIEKTTHGGTNSDIKTAGRVTVGDMVWDKVRPLPQPDNWGYNRLKRAQDIVAGGGELPSAYKEVLVIKELSTDGITTVNSWVCEGSWVCKISQNSLDRQSSDNVIETVTWSVDKCYRL